MQTYTRTHTHTPIQLESAAFHTYLYAPWPASCVLCPRTVIANFAHVSSTSFAKLKVKTCPKLLPPFLFLSPSFSLSLFPTYSKFLAYQRNTSASQDVCQLPDAFALVSCEINWHLVVNVVYPARPPPPLLSSPLGGALPISAACVITC